MSQPNGSRRPTFTAAPAELRDWFDALTKCASTLLLPTGEDEYARVSGDDFGLVSISESKSETGNWRQGYADFVHSESGRPLRIVRSGYSCELHLPNADCNVDLAAVLADESHDPNVKLIEWVQPAVNDIALAEDMDDGPALAGALAKRLLLNCPEQFRPLVTAIHSSTRPYRWSNFANWAESEQRWLEALRWKDAVSNGLSKYKRQKHQIAAQRLHRWIVTNAMRRPELGCFRSAEAGGAYLPKCEHWGSLAPTKHQLESYIGQQKRLASDVATRHRIAWEPLAVVGDDLNILRASLVRAVGPALFEPLSLLECESLLRALALICCDVHTLSREDVRAIVWGFTVLPTNWWNSTLQLSRQRKGLFMERFSRWTQSNRNHPRPAFHCTSRIASVPLLWPECLPANGISVDEIAEQLSPTPRMPTSDSSLDPWLAVPAHPWLAPPRPTDNAFGRQIAVDPMKEWREFFGEAVCVIDEALAASPENAIVLRHLREKGSVASRWLHSLRARQEALPFWLRESEYASADLEPYRFAVAKGQFYRTTRTLDRLLANTTLSGNARFNKRLPLHLENAYFRFGSPLVAVSTERVSGRNIHYTDELLITGCYVRAGSAGETTFWMTPTYQDPQRPGIEDVLPTSMVRNPEFSGSRYTWKPLAREHRSIWASIQHVCKIVLYLACDNALREMRQVPCASPDVERPPNPSPVDRRCEVLIGPRAASLAGYYSVGTIWNTHREGKPLPKARWTVPKGRETASPEFERRLSLTAAPAELFQGKRQRGL